MGVADGDSLLLELPGGERVRVRLFGIDAPEKDQELALAARKKLTRLVYDKFIRVEVQDIDQYGRYVGKVYVGARYANRFMLKEGLAWHYAYYAPDAKDLAAAEKNARKSRTGLWKDKNPVNPYDFRKLSR